MKSFGERVRAARMQRGWTQSRLAHASGLTQSAIANYETGLRAAPSGPALIGLATALDVAPEWLQQGSVLIRTADTASIETVQPIWPFPSIEYVHYQSLSVADKQVLEAIIVTFIRARLDT
jgi:transcriptional regulator with XRE-family HTH domain